MKKRLTATTFLIVLAALLVSNAMGVWFLFNQERQDARESLHELLSLIDYQDMDASQTALQFQQAAPDKRLTLIAADGSVLADTQAQGQLENHATRPEVVSARATGWGEDVRASDTVGEPMLYVAKLLANGTVARASMSLSSIDSLVWQSCSGFLAASLVALLLALALSRRMARRTLAPLSAVGDALSSLLSDQAPTSLDQYRSDDELRPILRYIDKLMERLSESLRNLKDERNKVTLILDCMDEGLLLLDEQDGLLACNRAARELFGVPDGSADLSGLLIHTRSLRLREALERCHTQKTPVFLDVEDLPEPGRILRFFLSPVSGRQYAGEQVGTSILISDVTELKQAERVRTEFTANVSHELKTPLTSIKGFADMLSSGMVTAPEDQKRFSSLIGVEVDRLIALINDILQISELDSVAIEQEECSTPLLSAAQEVADLLALKAREQQITLSVTGEECQGAISSLRYKEVLVNLVENGIKYNRPGGSVTVKVERQGEQAVLTVTDTGIGIPPDSLGRVFERFYRVDRGRARKMGGTGLGLAIVKHIVALYGGEVSVASQLDVGSTFRITLPCAAPQG